MSPRAVPVAEVEWTPCERLVPSRYPPIDLFERVSDPADWDAVILVESLTNSRLREQVGEIALVPPAHRAGGTGSSYIMAPFTHLSGGGRFSTRAFGAYYAALELETAIRETVHHRERFLRATREPPMEVDMREVRADLRAALHDLRGAGRASAALYDPRDYAASQAFATALRGDGSEGIVYDSVRHPGGECVAVFVPARLSRARQGAHFCYVWDGERITEVYQKTGLRRI